MEKLKPSEEKTGEETQARDSYPEFLGNNPPTKEKENKENSEIEKLLTRVNELKSKEVPEGKFKLPSECYNEIIKKAIFIKQKSPEMAKTDFDHCEYQVRLLEKSDGAIEKDIGEKLWSLFSDPEISIGIHGIVAEADSDFGSENSTFLKDGVGCRYPDLKRTIAFQDRGKIHAHGNITFPELLNYGYPASVQVHPLMIKKTIKHSETVNDKTRTWWEEEKVPAKQFSAIVAIPKSFYTNDQSLRSDKQINIAINSPFDQGKQVSAKPLNPIFVVGVVSDSDPNTIVWNPDFDAEKVRELSRQREAEKKAEEERKTNETQEEQIPQPKIEKKRPFGLWGLINKLRKRN